MNNDFILAARQDAINWAKDLIKRNPAEWIILDTETTGLNSNDEIIQIGIIDGAGNALIDNQLIKPACEISNGAFAVNGISAEMVKDAPNFGDVIPQIVEAVKGKHLVIYNAAYDLRMLIQSDKSFQMNIDEVACGIICAMNKYAQFVGEWNDYRGSFRWQKLPSGDHSAIGDCRATLKLINLMADQDTP